MAPHERSVGPDRRKHPNAELGRERRRSSEEPENPAPGDEPERDLEAAGPVDPKARRVRSQPVVDVPRTDHGVALVPRQPIRMTQLRQPLVTVQLPDDLAVTHASGIQGIKSAPVNEGTPPARYRVEVPVDRLSEGKLAVPQEVEAPADERLGLRHHALVPGGKKLGEEDRRRIGGRALEEEGRAS